MNGRGLQAPMTSRERVLTAVAHREPDRVPFFLPVTMHGALEVGMPVGQYLRTPQAVAEGQLRLRAKYPDDIVYPFLYGAIEHEAFGGEVEFPDDGPPVALGALFSSAQEVSSFVPPHVGDSAALGRTIQTISLLAPRVAGEALIAGVVMSPFSLPVMQLGFDVYFELLHDRPEVVADLLARNLAFTIEWANAQLAAGADVIGYFDPVSSPTILPLPIFRQFGLPAMREAMTAIHGPCLALYASGHCRALLGDLADTPAVIVGASSDEDLADIKAQAAGRTTVMGNLNGIEMRRWTPAQARSATRAAILAAAPGGGFILSDTHGEIPLQVGSEVLTAICAAVEEFGHYPIQVSGP